MLECATRKVAVDIPLPTRQYMSMARAWLFIIAWVGAISGSFAAFFTVTLNVMDADKKPVSNATAALFWDFENGTMKPRSDRPVTSDARGKAVLEVDDWNRPRAVMVMSADQKLGGVIAVSNDNREVTVTLVPTVRVKGKLECKELNFKPAWANTMVIPDGVTSQVMQQMGESAEFDFMLPAGKYTLRSYGTDVEGRKDPITLTADQREHDLGTLDLKPSAIARLKGKPAPGWKVTDARGIKKNSKLSDYKGKWLYLEFWGFW